ncbi:MASE1 domain-containing protein [Phormidesmis sp. 146-35]
MQAKRVNRRWLTFLLCAIALILAHLTALLFRVQPAVSLWFPPSGVAVAIGIWLGLPGIVLTGLVSCLMASFWGNHGWAQLVGWTDSTEPLVAWFLYRVCWRGSPFLTDLREAGAFILAAPVMGCLSSAIVGSLSLVALGKMSLNTLPESISYWWLGNAIGTMTIAPPALLLLTPLLQKSGYLIGETDPPRKAASFRRLRDRRDWAEIFVILIFSTSTAFLTVSQTTRTGFSFQQFSFLNFVSIIWAATRFGVVGGTLTASFCVFATLVAYLTTYPNAIALPSFPVSAEVLYVHKLSLLMQCGVSLLMGIAMTQRAATQVALAVEKVKGREYQARVALMEQLEATNTQLEQSNADKDELLIREQAARQEAESANRLKDEFLAVLSHELRSPLNPILGWTSLLRTRKFDEAATSHALEVIERNAKLQSQLVEDLLDVSKILRGKINLNFVSVSLSNVILAALETVRIAAEAKSVAIETQFDSTIGPVRGDPNRLQQIVWNLLSNAVKFTPAGGQVNVSLERIELPALEFPPEALTSFAQVVVSDTGKGIKADFLPHVFDYFRQEDSSTTRSYGGLGLGLAIVRQLVELHNGTVLAESPGEGQGARFTVRLPLGGMRDEG